MSTANSQALGVAGGLLITAVYRDSPAEMAGLEPQDVLIGIDQTGDKRTQCDAQDHRHESGRVSRVDRLRGDQQPADHHGLRLGPITPALTQRSIQCREEASFSESVPIETRRQRDKLGCIPDRSLINTPCWVMAL